MITTERSWRVVDLRSDTTTEPTPAMREACARAIVGDDGYGEDPTVSRLEDLAADRLGKESALLTASGTMANLLAILVQTSPAGGVLLDCDAHIVRSEGNGISRVAQARPMLLPGTRGMPDPGAMRAALAGPHPERRPELFCLENTHNFAGGAVLPQAAVEAACKMAHEYGLKVHLDGSRLLNAAVTSGQSPATLAAPMDTVAICLSKGLSAPVGSILAGPGPVIAEARAVRRMLGGGMRQAGIIAAAGIVALESMVLRLAQDHERAARLARSLQDLDPRLVDPSFIETNILVVDIGWSGQTAKSWVEALQRRRVSVKARTETTLRIVVHRHIDDAAIAHTLDAFAGVLKR